MLSAVLWCKQLSEIGQNGIPQLEEHNGHDTLDQEENG